MTDDRHQRLQEVFLRARRLDDRQREAFIDEACRDTPELRTELAKLLAHDAAPHEFLERAVSGGGAAYLAREIAPSTSGPSGAASDDPMERPLPERIGRYRIVRMIARGGMGIVYEAVQDTPQRRVALKVIRPGLMARSVLRRFRLEAEVLGRLTHPGIAKIHEAGTADGQPFFAMEFVDGPPLLEHAAAANLGIAERLELVGRICDALQHAHQNGVIHRDLKPSNILVGDDGGIGRPRILDFGVARATDADIQAATMQTDMGELVGTVPYMSPEQAAGDPKALDTRTDIYSVGVLAFELLCGRRPYDLSGKMVHEAVRIIREHEPSRLSSFDRGCRGDIETIVAKALDKDKERRYASAGEMAADIRRYLRNQPIVARPASMVYQLRKFARRNRALVTGVGIAFVAMMLATAVSTWQAGVARIAEHEAKEQKTIADTRADALYESTIASALRAAGYGDSTVGVAALQALGESARDTWEYRYLAGRLDQAAVLLECAANVRAAVFDADGSVLTVDETGLLQRWSPDASEGMEAVKLDAAQLGPAMFSADGAALAAIVGPDGAEAGVWATASGRRVTTIPAQSARMISISSDGRFVVIGPEAGAVWDVESGTSVDVQLTRGSRGLVAFAGDEHHLVNVFTFRDGQNRIVSIDTATGHRTVRKDTYTSPMSVVPTADGTHVVVGASDHTARMFDLRSGSTVRFFSGHTAAVTALALDAGERRLATGSSDQTVRIWDLAAGETLLTLAGSSGPISAVAFSPDDARVLAVAGHAVRIFDLAPPPGSTALRGHESYVYGVGVFGDDLRVASGSWDGVLRLWDSATGECLAAVPSGAGRINSLVVKDAPFIATGHHARVRLWSRDTAELLRDVPMGVGGRVTALDMTPDGSRLAVRQNNNVTVLDPRTGETLMRVELRVEHPEFGCIAITADGSRVAASQRGGDTGVVICDVPSGRIIREVGGFRSRVEDLAFSPDGRRLAAGMRDARARVWDVESGALIDELSGHASAVWSVAFTSDGRRLATGSEDRLIMIWDVERGTRVLTLAGHEDYVYDLAFSKDGTALVSGSGDHTVRVWDTRPRWRRARLSSRPRPE